MILICKTFSINAKTQALIDYNKAIVTDYYNLGKSLLSDNPTIIAEAYKDSTEFIVVNYDGTLFDVDPALSQSDILKYLQTQSISHKKFDIKDFS